MNDYTRQGPAPHQTEQYLIKANIRMDNGYWKWGHVFSVWVEPGPSKGTAHDRARQAAATLYPGCKIISVAYA